MKKIFLIVILVALCAIRAQLVAGNVVTNSRIDEPYFSSLPRTVSYDKYSSLPGTPPNFSTGMIEVGIDEEKKIYHNQEFTSVVTVNYNYYNFGLSATSSSQVFVVNYDPVQKYKPQSLISITNAARIVITGITVVTYQNYGLPGQTVVSDPGDLYVETSIDADETPTFNYTSATSVNMGYNIITASGNPTDMEVYWDYVNGAEQYEMEYIHVDDYDASSLAASKSPFSIGYDFAHDATRIVTTNQYYRIPLVYEHGYIIFRVRGIGRVASGGARLEGIWSNSGYAASDIGSFSSAFASQSYQVNSHEGDNIHWSTIQTFAESGISGIGVSYQDALSKNRQNVAKLNSENKTMVQSTLYDWYGRPAVSVMPSPMPDSYLSYKQNTNLSLSGAMFDKDLFDNAANFATPNVCSPSGLQMSPSLSSGAANYYSPNNSDQEVQQAMVPDANGYPYAQVEYYPDQTGRVKRESSPGNAHFLGSGKEAFYAYTVPSQQELCRLFGTEVGRYDEYEKLTQIDPNGQISVEYIDDEGKVIAKGLYGANPANLNPIDGALDPASNISTPLINNLDDPANFVLETGTSFFAAAGETQSVDYAVTVPVYTDSNCAPNLCMDCIYELNISVKDQCGNEILDADSSTPGIQPVTQLLGRYQPTFDVSCPSPTTTLHFSFGTHTLPFSFNVPVNGTYYLSKTLKLSEQPLQYYTQQYFASNSNTCVTQLSTFQQAALQDVDISSCQNFDCATCSTAVMTSVASLSPPLSQAQIDMLIEKCQLKCDMADPCLSREKLMRLQFSPGGYFGKYNPGVTYSSTLPYSIFNPGNSLSSILQIVPSGSYAYNIVPSPGYGSYTIMDPVTSAMVPPSSLSSVNYVSHWNSNFATPWVKWHPEYCKLQFTCDPLIQAMTTYSNAIFNATSYNNACMSGLLLPWPGAGGLPSSPVPSCPNGCGPTGTQFIPIFSYGGPTAFNPGQISTAFSAFTSSFTNTTFNSTSGSVSGNLYEFAEAITNSITLVHGGMPQFGTSSICNSDFEWQIYQQMYLNLIRNTIQELENIFIAGWSPANGGCLNNSYIAANLPNYIPIFDDPGSYPVIPTNAMIASTPPSVLLNNSQTQMQSTCQSFCQSYVTNWLSDLAPCGITTGPTWTAMQNDLVSVCTAGCDSQDPFGATNSNTGVNITVGSTPYTVYTFQDVLNAYGYPQTSTCNQYLVNWPHAKGYNLGGNSSGGSGNNGSTGAGPVGTPTLDACSCNKILAEDFAYTNNVGVGFINPCITTESDYFQQQLGINLPNLSSYICICRQAKDPTTNTYNFANVTIPSFSMSMFPVPAQLACSNCIPCSTLGATPLANVNAGIAAAFGVTSYSSLPQTVLTNYLNNTYNLNVTYDQWMTFFNDCVNNYNSSTGTYGGANGIGSLLSPQANDIANFLNLLYNLGYMQVTGFSATYTLTQANAAFFFASGMWQYPNVPTSSVQAQVNPGTGGPNDLVITLSNASLGYFCSFTIPVPSALPNTSVYNTPSIHFHVVKGTCGSGELAGTRFYTEFTYYDAASNTNITDTILINNTCYNSLAQPNIYNTSGFFQCQPYLCSNTNYGGTGTGTTTPNTGTASCMSMLINSALNTAQTNYNNYIQDAMGDFIAAYKNYCYSNVVETFERGYFLNEYQYTLNYFDRSGNLVNTVPPKGVQLLTGTALTNAVNYSMNGTGSPVYPGHSLNQTTGIDSYGSHSVFNSFDNPTRQLSPDDGEIIYFYDANGRLVASQNAQQLLGNTYSYTRYDDHGRIIEVGLLKNPVTLTQTITLNPIKWNNYVTSASIRTEVMRTYYNDPLNTIVNGYFPSGQKFLANRATASTFEWIDDSNDNTYNNGTFYSYDDDGNANYIVQERPGDYLKTYECEYDLISAKVNKVIYNRGAIDQLFHKYYYDRDNRLKDVLTSQDGLVYQRDAKYFYYQHGPLARTELGEKQVQATDYVFTLLGWIKGVNSNVLLADKDIGKDGDPGNNYLSSQTGLHGDFAKDAASYSLHYFAGDYNPIKSASANFIADMTNLNAGSGAFIQSADAPDLYNGNIAAMVTSIHDINTLSPDVGLPKPQITGYRYDQLQRVNHMKAYSSLRMAFSGSDYSEAIDLANNQWISADPSNYTGAYEMDIKYDKLGNIINLNRAGDPVFPGSWSFKAMDKLTYNYQNSAGIVTSAGTIQKNSQLLNINDDTSIPSTNYPTDVEDQVTGNYKYNGFGSITQDLEQEIQTIEWTNAHKVKSIVRTTGSTKPDIYYDFDAFGRKVYKKIVYKDNAGNIDPSLLKETFYVLDVAANVLAVYDRITTSGSPDYRCNELMVYGSGRLGLINCNLDVTLPLQPTTSGFDEFFGAKSYELANHLGNVITTISDRKRPIDGVYQFLGRLAGPGDSNFDGYNYTNVGGGNGFFQQITPPDGTVDSYFPDIKTTSDYYVFGQTMASRTYALSGADYRYGMNGQEKEGDVFDGALSAEYWMYDSRTGRRFENDPITHDWESPYVCFSNNPILLSDPSGGASNNKQPPRKKFNPNKRQHMKGRFWDHFFHPFRKKGKSTNPDAKKGDKKPEEKPKKDPQKKPDEQPKNPHHPSSSSKDKAPGFLVRLGDAIGSYGHLATSIGQLYGSRKTNFYNTKFNNASGHFAPDEPDDFVQMEGRLKNNLEWVFLGMKQKMDPLANGFKLEANTAIEVGLASRLKWFDSKNMKIYVDYGGSLGISAGHPLFSNGAGQVYFNGVGAPGQDKYTITGVSATAFVRLDATFFKVVTIFATGSVHHFQSRTFNTSQGPQSFGNIGSAELTVGIGINFGGRKK